MFLIIFIGKKFFCIRKKFLVTLIYLELVERFIKFNNGFE